MKQLFFVLILATVVVLMVSAEEKAEPEGDKSDAGGKDPKETSGSSMTTLATASLIGLTFNVLKNLWQ